MKKLSGDIPVSKYGDIPVTSILFLKQCEQRFGFPSKMVIAIEPRSVKKDEKQQESRGVFGDTTKRSCLMIY